MSTAPPICQNIALRGCPRRYKADRAWREGSADEDVLTGSTPDELNAAIRADRAREGTT